MAISLAFLFSGSKCSLHLHCLIVTWTTFFFVTWHLCQPKFLDFCILALFISWVIGPCLWKVLQEHWSRGILGLCMFKNVFLLSAQLKDGTLDRLALWCLIPLRTLLVVVRCLLGIQSFGKMWASLIWETLKISSFYLDTNGFFLSLFFMFKKKMSTKCVFRYWSLPSQPSLSLILATA